MKITLQSQAGIEIQLRQVVFHQPAAGETPLRNPSMLPAMRVDSTLLASVRDVGGIATTTGALRIDSAGFGVLYAYGNGSLATLVFDLSTADVRSWLSGAEQTRVLPVIMQYDSAAKLVQVPFDADIAHLANIAVDCTSPSTDDIVFAMQLVVSQLESPAALSQAGLAIGPLHRASVSFLTPSGHQVMPTALH